MNEEKEYKPKIITSTTNYVVSKDNPMYGLDQTYIPGVNTMITLNDILYIEAKLSGLDEDLLLSAEPYFKVLEALDKIRKALTITKTVDGDVVSYKVNVPEEVIKSINN